MACNPRLRVEATHVEEYPTTQLRQPARSAACHPFIEDQSYHPGVSQDRVATFYRQLGRLLAAWREERGLSQEALAVQLQRDQSYISRIEAGERHAGVTFLLEWAEALNLPFDDVATKVSELWRAVG
jgi:ribosome-binding protein aMBF1 (putative translation factor)